MRGHIGHGLRYDMMERITHEGMNWVENLPLYHRSIGLLCPFEVYYGRKHNSLKIDFV